MIVIVLIITMAVW